MDVEAYQQQEKATRRQRDFVTNPTFQWVLEQLEEMKRKEMISLQAAARGGNLAEINHGAGKVDQLDIVRAFFQRFRSEVLRPPEEEGNPPEDSR